MLTYNNTPNNMNDNLREQVIKSVATGRLNPIYTAVYRDVAIRSNSDWRKLLRA